MRIIRSRNPAAVMNRVLYDVKPDPHRHERTRAAMARLNKSIGDDLFGMLEKVYDAYADEDIFEDIEELAQEVQNVQEERVGLLLGSKTKPNDKTRKVVMNHPVIYKMYKEKRLNGFGEAHTFDQDLYESIMDGYCDDQKKCKRYGGLEPTIKLNDSDRVNAIDNFYDIIEKQRKKIDLTDM